MRLQELAEAIVERLERTGPAPNPEAAHRIEFEFINPNRDGTRLPALLNQVRGARDTFYTDTSQFEIDGFYYRTPENMRNGVITMRLVWTITHRPVTDGRPGDAADPIGIR